MRVLVTGGSGFIGSHLTAQLAWRGLDVRILDNFASGRRSNVQALDPSDPVTIGKAATEESRGRNWR